MIGCDIIEIERVNSVFKKNGEVFLNKILSENEILLFNKRNNSKYFLSGRFAAKEAVYKCLRTDTKGLGFPDIEILSGEKGEPFVCLKGEKVDIGVSISHSKSSAMAVAVDNRSRL